MLPFDSSPKIWKTHDGAVTTILVLNVSVSKRDVRKYLITGSDDCYVKVWDLEYVIVCDCNNSLLHYLSDS